MDQAANLRKLALRTRQGEPGIRAVDAPAGSPRIIAIASGKGGVGKTNLAINMGILFAREGKRVVVMDADLGLANVNVILGVIPKYNLHHVLKGQKKLSEIMVDTPQGIKIIAGASGFSKLANLNEQELGKFVSALEELSQFDVVILDTGAGVSRNVLSFIIAAGEVIVVTTPEPTAITDAYGIIKSISAESSGVSMKLVVNRVPNIAAGRKVAERVINIAGQFLNVKVENLGLIYEDDVVVKSVVKQKPFVLAYPKSRAAYSVDHIVKNLLGIPVEEKQGGIGGFVKKFITMYSGKD